MTLAILATVSLTACWNTSDGQKTGLIVKLSRTGAFVKTWEAELIRGGFTNGSGINGSPFHFTIENKKLIEKVKYAFKNQKEIIITYHQEAVTGCMRGETHTFLDDIDFVKS